MYCKVSVELPPGEEAAAEAVVDVGYATELTTIEEQPELGYQGCWENTLVFPKCYEMIKKCVLTIHSVVHSLTCIITNNS